MNDNKETDKAPTGWGNVKPPEQKKLISAAGTYNLLIKEAWDSKFQLRGSFDYERKDNTKRLLGFNCVVVDSCPQEGRYIRVQLYIHTEKMQGHAINLFKILNLEMDNDIGPEIGLSVGDATPGQYFKGAVTMSQPRKEGDKSFPELAPWDIDLPDAQYKNELRQLSGDNENLPSIAHYEKDVENRKKRKEKESQDSQSDQEDDTLPF